MAQFIDHVFDVETSGKRSGMTRAKFDPPRITQFGHIRIDPSDPSKFKAIVGGGPGHGWTNLIEPFVEKHNIQSELDLTPGFWRDLAAYDRSVLEKGSVLNDQVRAHVREYLALRKTGRTGEMKSATEYIKTFQKAVQADINRGNVVRLHAYHKGFDVTQTINEMFQTSPKEGRAFMDWLEKHVQSGKLKLRGIEEGIHEGMFNIMMREPDVLPRFASARYFEKAKAAGLKTVGLEATTPHYALREMLDDIKALKGGAPAKQVLQGVPAEVAAEMRTVKSYEDFQRLSRFLERNREAKDLLMGHYKRRVASKYGAAMGKHVTELGFEYVANWKQDIVARLLKMPEIEHRAFKDAISSWGIHLQTSHAKTAEDIARTVMTDEVLMAEQIGIRYAKFLQEGASAVKQTPVNQLMNVAHQTRIAPPAALSRLARSPNTLPLLAAAGGLFIAHQIAKGSSDVPLVDSMRKEMAGKIEGIRQSIGQWDQAVGINPTKMKFGNVSDFGSGREGSWTEGSYRGVQFSPGLDRLRHQWSLHPEWQYSAQMAQAYVSLNRYGPSRQEIDNQMIDLNDYIYEMKDADSILLRKAWLSKKVPIAGPIMGFMQQQVYTVAKMLTGQDFGFSVRVKDIDAPELAKGGKAYIPGAQPGAEEATELMERIMGGTTIQRILQGGRATHIRLSGDEMTYDRYVGTPYSGSRDLAGELVRAGGAISTDLDQQYVGAEQIAMSQGRGIWEHPEYHGVPAARKHGVRPALSYLKRYTGLGRSLDAAATYSLMAYSRNPHLHSVRDQYAQNLYSRGF